MPFDSYKELKAHILMNCETPFGRLHLSEDATMEKVQAVLRALNWCHTLAKGSLWERFRRNGSDSLTQTINGHVVEIFPLKAALLDTGIHSMTANHLPINLDGRSACVRAHRYTRPQPLHTDMVASMILLLGSEGFDPKEVPHTLHAILDEEQRALVPHTPHQPHIDDPRFDTRTFTSNDEDTRAFIETQPVEDWNHYAHRLSPTRHQTTFRWILLQLTLPGVRMERVSRWIVEQFYSHRYMFSDADVELFFNHDDPSLRSWAVEHFHCDDVERELSILRPMLTDIASPVLHKVLTRLRSVDITEQEKLKLFVPLLKDRAGRCSIGILHIGHLNIGIDEKRSLLSPFLESHETDHVVNAVRSLGMSGDAKTEQVLRSQLNHENDQVVRSVLQNIEEFGPWFEQVIPSYYERPQLHQALLAALRSTTGFSPVPYITHLLKGQRNTIIVRGISTMANIGCESAIEAIGNYLLAFKSIYVRRNAADYLGETGSESALKYLELGLQDSSPGVRQSSLRSKAKIHAVRNAW